MSSCSRDNLVSMIREQLGDCEKPYTWSEKHIDQAIDIAARQIVNSNREEFSRTVEIFLKNGSCIQSACPECDGIIEVVGNVNGACDSPLTELNDTDKYYSDIYSDICTSDPTKDYRVESVDILGDGGCEFQVTPEVPSSGTYKINVLCVQYPDLCKEFPETICRHFNELYMVAMSIVYMLEDDPITQEKSNIFFNRYLQISGMEREIDRDVFLREVLYGVRRND